MSVFAECGAMLNTTKMAVSSRGYDRHSVPRCLVLNSASLCLHTTPTLFYNFQDLKNLKNKSLFFGFLLEGVDGRPAQMPVSKFNF